MRSVAVPLTVGVALWLVISVRGLRSCRNDSEWYEGLTALVVLVGLLAWLAGVARAHRG